MARPATPSYSDSLAFLLSQIGARSAQIFGEVLAAAGLTPRQFGVLSNLDAVPGQSQQQLADALGIHRNNMVTLVDELEAAGWVRRQRSPTDRRAFELQLTASGTAAVRRVLRQLPSVEAHLSGPLDDQDHQELGRLLRTVADGLGLQPGVHPHLGAGR